MAILNTKVDEDGRITATIFVNIRHGEYGLPNIESKHYPMKFEYYTLDTDNWGSKDNVKDLRTSNVPITVWKPLEDEYGSWGTFLTVEGLLYGHFEAFSVFAGTLMPSLDPSGYRPGGDDDFFDYYPSGLDALREYALDLDELNRTKHKGMSSFYMKPGFLGVYHNVLLDFFVREARRPGNCDTDPNGWLWEHVPDLVKELATDKGIEMEDVIDYVNAIAALKENELGKILHDMGKP